ncbi:MAG: M48 family metalloprotease [Rhodobacteraceae bacterium]|nr:M48 family metalloprotease [Paracoccaceae bacterium]
MQKLLLLGLVASILAGCIDTAAPVVSKPVASVSQGAANLDQAILNYRRVSARVEPVAEQVCRSFHRDKPATFCDFQIVVRNAPNEPANAFQGIGKDGRPVITFNSNMLLQVQNDDELAFVLGHEAGHQIASHLIQSRNNQMTGALILGILVAVGGGDADVGVDLGAQIGGRAYSKKFELQADSIGAHIADRAGYNAARGAQELARTGGSSNWLSTHPSSGARVANVQNVVAEIHASKAAGNIAPIHW